MDAIPDSWPSRPFNHTRLMEPTVVRQCGLIEHYSTSRHSLGLYRGIANACQYVIAKDRLQDGSIQAVVEEALARLIVRVGGLRVGITDEDTNKASFVRVPSLDLQDYIEWKTVATSCPSQHDEQILCAIKQRLEQLWPDVATRPPWKLLVVLNQSQHPDDVVLDMIFATHHAIADGKSTAVFHSELLKELNSSSSPPPELEKHILTFSQPPVLAPSQEELIQPQISWAFLFKSLWEEFGPAWLTGASSSEPWTGRAITLEPQKLHLRLVSVNPDIVARLVTTARVHGTTLTGALHVLILASLARRLPADTATHFVGETAIGLLPWANLPRGVDMDLQRVLTVLNTGCRTVWDAATIAMLRSKLNRSVEGAEEEFLWPLAASWRADMKAKIQSLPKDDVVGLLSYVTDWRKRWLGKIGVPRDATWAVSNIGSMKVVDKPGPGGWSIQRAFFTQPANVVGPAFAVNVTGVDGAELNMVLNWQETVVETAILDGVADDLRTWLERFGKSGKFGVFEATH